MPTVCFHWVLMKIPQGTWFMIPLNQKPRPLNILLHFANQYSTFLLHLGESRFYYAHSKMLYCRWSALSSPDSYWDTQLYFTHWLPMYWMGAFIREPPPGSTTYLLPLPSGRIIYRKTVPLCSGLKDREYQREEGEDWAFHLALKISVLPLATVTIPLMFYWMLVRHMVLWCFKMFMNYMSRFFHRWNSVYN